MLAFIFALIVFLTGSAAIDRSGMPNKESVTTIPYFALGAAMTIAAVRRGNFADRIIACISMPILGWWFIFILKLALEKYFWWDFYNYWFDLS